MAKGISVSAPTDNWEQKMYIAIGVNEVDFENCGDVAENHRFVQTALIFFARDKRSARRHAKKLLVNEPYFLRAIGRVNVDITGKKQTEAMPGYTPTRFQEFHFADQGGDCSADFREEADWLQSDESRRTDATLGSKRERRKKRKGVMFPTRAFATKVKALSLAGPAT